MVINTAAMNFTITMEFREFTNKGLFQKKIQRYCTANKTGLAEFYTASSATDRDSRLIPSTDSNSSTSKGFFRQISAPASRIR